MGAFPENLGRYLIGDAGIVGRHPQTGDDGWRPDVSYGRVINPGDTMFRKFTIASIFVALSAVASFAAEFGDLSGTYSGKTAKGGDILIVVPKTGTPSYRFRGSPVLVSSAKLSGKTISMNVGPTGMGKVVISSTGNGMSYKYTDGQGSTVATLAKQ
jgi:hypothetical protein